jgi:hypothetical protein
MLTNDDLNPRYHNMRSIDDFKIPKFRTTLRERSIVVSGPKNWNPIPVELKAANSVVSFKFNLRHFFINAY